jgi:hypothetical protein
MHVSSFKRKVWLSGGQRKAGRRCRRSLPALALLLSSDPGFAGAPFLTDDPVPTEPGHWEINAPIFELGGHGRDLEVTSAADFSYGAATDVQLSLAVSIAGAHDTHRWRSGVGDVELSAKYRFINDETSGLQVAAFPGLSLPTASNGMGAGRVTALLPVWFQKDSGKWSVFGGGGYAINLGAGNRNYWTGGIAVSKQFSDRFLLGVEYDRQGANELGGHGSSSLGLGAIYALKAPFRLLLSGGPTIENQTHQTGFHAFLALGMDY